MRLEKDLIGEVSIPLAAPYGAQTQRALDLYPLAGGKPISAYPVLVEQLLKVKQAAVFTNRASGELDQAIADALLEVIDNLLTQLPNDIDAYFPVHAFHGGGGISTNMNVNEVLANLTNKALGVSEFGTYSPVHPNNHINLNHSTSDFLNTACHLSVLVSWRPLKGQIQQLVDVLRAQAARWQSVKKISRTCLQDAVEITFGDLFGGYAATINRSLSYLQSDIQTLHKVNIGGNIIGRKGDCSEAFYDTILPHLRQVTGIEALQRSDNLIDCSQNFDDLIRFASTLEQLALGLIKIAKDLRLMSSGPQAGFGELRLPAVQQGSSAMPGKINPTVPEFLIQSCMQVSGYCHTVRMTHEHGELDYNPWESIVIANVLDAMATLGTGIQVFTKHCVAGLEPNIERNQQNLETIIPTMVSIMQAKGYAHAVALYKECHGDLARIRQALADDQ